MLEAEKAALKPFTLLLLSKPGPVNSGTLNTCLSDTRDASTAACCLRGQAAV